ncbi:MAG: histidine kinase [Opitutaceae bacterium]|nr:histidine kinase [Opitutaceae bacterium]
MLTAIQAVAQAATQPTPKATDDKFAPVIGSSAVALRTARLMDALALARKTTARAKADGDVRTVIESLIDEARAHGHLTDYPAAFASLQEAFSMAEKFSDQEPLAMVEYMLGNIYGSLREWPESRLWHERSLERMRRLGSPEVYRPLSGIAFEEFNRGDIVGARRDYAEALELARTHGGLREVGAMMHGLSLAERRLGERDAALRHMREAVLLREQMGDPYYLASSLVELSAMLRADGEAAAAAELLARAQPLAEAVDSARILAPLYREAAEAATQRGEWQQAYESLCKFHDASQRELDEFRAQQAAVLSARFEAAQKEQRIATLTRQSEAEAAARSRAEWVRNYLITISAGAVLVAVLVFIAYRYKRRAASLADMRAERAQLTMLRYQLNPHLLFNTLNSIRSLALTDPAKARDLVSRLAAFCRRVLAPGDAALITLQEEWAGLQDFLAIEQARWEDLLTVESELDPNAADLLVPPMLLQPLVENAVKYGQQTTPGDLRVRLAARLERGALVLSVANLGRWIPPAAADGSTHVGWENVRARLATAYGGRASLQSAEADGWVVVTMRIEHGVLRRGQSGASAPRN